MDNRTQSGALDRAGLRRVVAVLSVTEITSWGVLYYAFPVLLTSITADTGWSTTMTTGAFSTSLVVAAIVGIGVGRVIDRHGPRRVMTAGSLLAVPAVILIATASSYPAFIAGWVIAGLAMSGVLYAPAFAALTHWAGSRRIGALTTVTLVAGLASTVFAPLTAVINDHLDWRHTYLVLVVALAVITVPAHWFGLRPAWTPNQHPASSPNAAGSAHSVTRSRPFLLLALSLSAAAFTVYAVVINLVPLLEERGFSSGRAALALGLGGIGQLAGRLGYARFSARTGTTQRTVLVIVAVAATTMLLAVLPGPALLLLGLSVLIGVFRGTFTLIQATAVSDRWGSTGFGRLNGLLSAPILFASAVAPFAGAAIADVAGGQPTAFLVLALVAVAAAVIALGTQPRHQDR